ncbi:MAG: isoleucine--tRNA ligase, partial [Pseudomonadota bacterium]
DIVPRYFTMKGYYVHRRFGWDCHGLPVEHEIDKKLGMSAQDAVKQLGIKGYNDECRSIVQRYTTEWEKTITRLGRWVDFENDYKTMDATFMESVWWAFKQLWDKNLIYKGTKVVPFSTALGTVLSNFEASSNYQDVQDPAITIMFKLKDENTFISAWTTTPWTLPSNLALCVNTEIDYVKVHDDANNFDFYLAEARLSHYTKSRKKKLSVLEKIKGKDLVGKKYEPLFPYFAELSEEGAFQIVSDNYVTTEDGTGIVHIAPDFGEDDWRILKNLGLNIHACPISDEGKFTAPVSDYLGMYVKDADKEILRHLKGTEKLYDHDTCVHSYPFCPRSDTPLIYKAIPSWYVKVEQIKDRLQAVNQQINWVPDHIKDGRFGKWLEGARDWAISRNRIWGTPFPIWSNDSTGDALCLGSIEELEDLSGTKVNDLHRENVDGLTFKISGKEGTYKRIPEVLDCWFESGSMPYAQLHYPFENKKIFEAGFPAKFIAEGLDQTRGWFYTLTVLSTAIFDRPAFKNVIVNGMVMSEDGKKMSKRLKNYTPPDQLMETYGADALRLYLINSGLVKAEEQRFADSGVKDMVRRALLPWYNAFKFFQTYAEVDGWNPQKHFKLGINLSDRSIISELQTLKKNIAREMEGYKLYNVVPALFTFIENLTNWYIRLNRPRFWGEGLSEGKKEAYSTLYTTLTELSQAMAPFAPFLADHLYQELKKLGPMPGQQDSVHLCPYPTADEKLIDPALEDAMNRMHQIILLGRQKRNQVQIKVKIPLSRLTIIHKDEKMLQEIAKLEDYIRAELNVKNIEYTTDEGSYIKLYAKPNAPILGKRLGKSFGKYRQIIEALPPDLLSLAEKEGKINVEGETFTVDELLIYREPNANTQTMSNRFISVDLSTELNPDLITEGFAREVVNRIQKTRKELNLNVADRIEVYFDTEADLTDAISKHFDYICGETLAVKLQKGMPHPEDAFSYELDDFVLRLNISKAQS